MGAISYDMGHIRRRSRPATVWDGFERLRSA
jgi:hypothetical protein